MVKSQIIYVFIVFVKLCIPKPLNYRKSDVIDTPTI